MQYYKFDFHPTVFIVVFFICLVLFYVITKFVAKKKFNSRQFLYISAFIFYILSLIKLTILPLVVFIKQPPDLPISLYYSYIPFENVGNAIRSGNYIQVFGNVLLLLPLPILLQLIAREQFSFKKTALISTIATFTIELLQLLIDFATHYPNKVADIDDIILNIFGALIGWFIFRVVLRFKYVSLKLNHQN
ncbi:hypothetical protein AWM70_00075 [Paenibacillus yonginensis]|uniref:VanZ-like domain-containing protein n=1 Tax=Paenibacillus yonginensis TaxID=1462996 RepID=A0A1B1MVH9_9BACL|nr:VanZ family protein [Paenibacillus yonginensis]ANS73176.1 hypothetical protein AWM70_00075 [Paenibacillus yonginensis]